MAMKVALLLLAVTSLCVGHPQGYNGNDGSDEKLPYSFSWNAARHYNGAPDREHREERGEDGITRGVFRYVDPSLNVQEVIYTADEDGFHVEGDVLPQHTQAQQAVIDDHARRFQEIADEHVAIGRQHAEQAGVEYVEPLPYVAPVGPFPHVDVPEIEQTPAVARARKQHAALFEKISAQHARIAAERKTPIPEEAGGPYQ